MERVFYDLNLEDHATWNHPYVGGWIQIFSQWKKSPSFISTWAVTASSYPKRFQAFYKNL